MLEYINSGKAVFITSVLDASGRAQKTAERLTCYTYNESSDPKYAFVFSASYGKESRDPASIYCHYFGLNDLSTDTFSNANLK